MNDPRIEGLQREQARLRLQLDELERRLGDLAWEGAPPPPAASLPVPAPAPAPESKAVPPPTPVAVVPPEPASPAPALAPRDSFELHLGRVWLVRIGIGMLLTGLIFLAGYAYQRFADRITPFDRAAALFLASLGLAGLGLWVERSRETLRAYGRVLAAGGLAGGYYALYASHYVPALRWIDGVVATNVLLMGWAAVIVALACRRRAETLAVAAIGLAYYTSLLGPDTAYTLVSNLILSGAAVFLTLRYGWKFVSYAALLGTYGTYAVSRFAHDAAPGDFALLASYWAVFALPVLWPRAGTWEGGERVTLLTLNNVAYLALGAFARRGEFTAVFPGFALAFGAVLVGAAFLSRLVRRGDAAQETAFLVQGAAVLTLGWLGRWHGPAGALILGVEGALLLFASAWRYGALVRFAAGVAGTVAGIWAAWNCADGAGWQGVPLCLVAAFAAQAFFLDRLKCGGGWYAALAALLSLVWIWERVPEPHQFWVLALGAAAVFAVRFVRPGARFADAVAVLFAGLAALVFVFVDGAGERTFWANGVALAGLFALEQFAVRRLGAAAPSRPAQAAWLGAVLLGGWMFLDETASLHAPSWPLTLVWAGIAGLYLALGLGCRERVARWAGLLLVAAALGRVVFVDVWDLDTLSRILTFLGLGALLLGLGFVYNRWQETIRKWL